MLRVQSGYACNDKEIATSFDGCIDASGLLMDGVTAAPAEPTQQLSDGRTVEIHSVTDQAIQEIAPVPENICIEISTDPPGVKVYKC